MVLGEEGGGRHFLFECLLNNIQPNTSYFSLGAPVVTSVPSGGFAGGGEAGGCGGLPLMLHVSSDKNTGVGFAS